MEYGNRLRAEMSGRSWWRGVVAAVLVGLGLTLAVACGAAEPDPMHRVSFQVERSTEVANDRITAVVGITDEDADSARLADRINTKMARALATAKGRAGVTVKSGGYSTHPVHQDGKLRRWRASQDLILESADIQAVTKLVGELQAELQLRSIQFSVSPERRREVEDELIAEVLAAFRARADLVRSNLGAKHYEIVRVDVNTQGGMPQPMMRMATMEMDSARASSAPALEGGSSKLSVHVNGTIELE
jgi:predicted secreted protein